MPDHPRPDIAVTTFSGAELPSLIPGLADLRVRVFRAFPYLYDGDLNYEADYLRLYLASPRAAVIVARQDGVIVGASTCIPLIDETANVQAPFIARGWRLDDFFYFGESVLLPGLRGQGLGVAFFNAREAHARAVSDCTYACFCAVIRPPNHPARPRGYTPLDAFWRNRGFSPRPDLTCEMTWRDLGDTEETTKTLAFWMKPLRDAPLP